MQADRINDVNRSIEGLDEVSALSYIAGKYPGKVVFSTSFGMEDQVITHMIFSGDIDVRVFTLDTGRLFQEAYAVWSRTVELYGKEIISFHPDQDKLREMISSKGPNSFYESVENRLECCRIRKVEPLKRALNGKTVWVTGIRKQQSGERGGVERIEWDDGNKIIKFHPLLDWTDEQVKDFIKKHGIPVNPLHETGYPSIGCQPCTRAVQPGQDARSGRWWWESGDKKECGIHGTHPGPPGGREKTP